MGKLVPQIQIRDDGDLEEVRALLDELRIEYSVASKEEDPPLPSHMLISSEARAVEALQEIGRGEHTHHFLHLIVVDQASSALREMPEREHCDMVARRPLHPTVLRLLVQRALYQGIEKRSEERVAVGSDVEIRVGPGPEPGPKRQSATLAELSRRGCGLVTRDRCKLWEPIEIDFPVALRGMTPLRVRGRTVGVQRGEVLDSGTYSIAVVFDAASDEVVGRIETIMRDHSVGPTGWLEQVPGTPASEVTAATQPSERRAHPRRRYPHHLLARDAGKIHSLIGRDLSIGGMRVADAPELTLGLRLELIIYGHAGVVPVMVSAEVVRKDGAGSAGLSFGPLEDGPRARLQAIVDGLGQIDLSCGTVISEVVRTS